MAANIFARDDRFWAANCALGVGAATVKLALLLKCRADVGFVPVYLRVTRPITRLIIALYP